MRKNKPDAQGVWDQLCPDDVLIKSIIGAVNLQKQTDMWRRRIGIPYAARWLRERRWTDEGDIPAGAPEHTDMSTRSKSGPSYFIRSGQWYTIQDGKETGIDESEVPQTALSRERDKPKPSQEDYMSHIPFSISALLRDKFSMPATDGERHRARG
jgi:hypothetical protein